ncbi:MAG: family 43 glycosylhydrolase [Verrucomicrobiota bacterium]
MRIKRNTLARAATFAWLLAAATSPAETNTAATTVTNTPADQITAPPPKPILAGFTADPSIRAFGDTYYIYPTSDRPNWNTTEFAVWSSKNLVTWKKEGVFMDLTKDLTWATNKAWAPDCVERDGKYFFYFCANHNIGVATGPTPVGPFKDALGQPLVEDAKIKTFTIDPCAFIDDDGQAYLYFGNGTPTVFKLNRDMISFDGPPVEFRLKQFREGIVVFKRLGKYYFMWSIDDARSPNYRVGWGIADSPLGPVRSPDTNFIVLQKHGPAVATAHHGVVNVPGTDRWYVAYHRHAIPNGSGYQREVCLARMEFDADGNIKPMDPMVSPFQPGDIGEPIINGKGRTLPGETEPAR